jgi:hypothetical protein
VLSFAVAVVLPIVTAPPARADPGILYLGEATRVAVETGPSSIGHTDIRWGVTGTDLGIMWTGSRGQTLIAFGDTYGPNGGDWRSGTLASSTDRHLADGMRIDSFVTDRPGHAGELLSSLKQDNVEMTKIPTGGVNIGGRDYLSYMSVRHWGRPGDWTTNYAGIAVSDDDGRSWSDVPSARRANNSEFSDPFQMVSMARFGRYVYLFGTPNGRFGNAYLARVSPSELTEPAAYQYWTGRGWSTGDESAAAAILPGPVGEISVAYNPGLHSWMMMYLDEGHHALTLRLGLTPAGPWTPQIVIASASDYANLYGGFLHPRSTGFDVYFTLSEFTGYNVSLLRLQLPGNLIATALNQLPVELPSLPNIGIPVPAVPVPTLPSPLPGG